MSTLLLGLGTALPAHHVEQPVAARLAAELTPGGNGHQRRLAALYSRARVERRHSVLLEATPDVAGDPLNSQRFYTPPADERDRGPTTGERMRAYARHAQPLAERAAAEAMQAAAVDPSAITHLVTVSCSGFAAPGFDVGLVGALGLSPRVERTHVGFMGCHGALNGLRVADAFVRADSGARVLLCAVELCSLHYQFAGGSDAQVANSLFADGAAAVVLGSAAGDVHWSIRASGACLLPDSFDAMTWTIGDHGFVMTLSPAVPSLIREHLRPWLVEWLSQHGLSPESVPTWAIHPGGPRILSAARDALGLPSAACDLSRAVLAECGNMSSPTLLFILRRLIAANAPRPCVAVAFGPGLAVEAALLG